MRNLFVGVTAFLGMAACRPMAEAQTLRMMKSLDAPHYDGAAHDLVADRPTSSTCSRTRWSRWTGTARRRSPTSPSRGPSAPTASSTPSSCATTSASAAARSSPPTTSSTRIKRLVEPRAQGAARLARRQPQGRPRHRSLHGRVRARTSPTPTCCCNLTMFTMSIHNKESVESLGKDYGVKAIDGTGPWCFESLAAAHRDRAEAPRRLQVGPLDVPEQGAGEVREAGRSRSCPRIQRASPP